MTSTFCFMGSVCHISKEFYILKGLLESWPLEMITRTKMINNEFSHFLVQEQWHL